MTRIGWARFLMPLLICASVSPARAADTECAGTQSELYSSKTVALTMCHGSNVSFDPSKLQDWQACTDGQIRRTDKRWKQTRVILDCSAFAPKEFSVRGDLLEIRHKITVYPGLTFETAVLESWDLSNKSRKFTFLKDLPVCGTRDIHNAANSVTAAIGKSAGGEAFIASVYGGLFKLRDCARSRPDEVPRVLQSYQKNQAFDGEVAETLGRVTDEARLLSAAAKSLTVKHTKTAR